MLWEYIGNWYGNYLHAVWVWTIQGTGRWGKKQWLASCFCCHGYKIYGRITWLLL